MMLNTLLNIFNCVKKIIKPKTKNNWLYIIIIICVAFLITALILGYHYSQTNKAEENIDWKVYRNEEWGFEFQYPKDWSFHENAFSSPFSKFNLIGTLPEETVPNTIIPSFLINIVTSDFADRAFYDIKNTALETNVGGVKGSKYEYDFEGFPQIAIDIPFGEYRMILGADRRYENTFNQIIASFKLNNF